MSSRAKRARSGRVRVGNPQIAIAYVRVSTDDQRLGPEAQRAAIEAWGRREGVAVVAWHIDQGVSGGSDLGDRPGLAAALADVSVAGAGVLVIAKRDRLARDLYIAATIEHAVAQGGARVACADGVANGDTPADAFMRAILDGAAAYERALIRARTKSALAAKRAKGERIGTLPFGYRLDLDGVSLVESPEEQTVIAEVAELRALGMTFRAIACVLKQSGVVSLRTGRSFGLSQVHAMWVGREKNSSVTATAA